MKLKTGKQATEITSFDKLRMSGNTSWPIVVSMSNHVSSVAKKGFE